MAMLNNQRVLRININLFFFQIMGFDDRDVRGCDHG
jgi:hypothetical protein